MGGRGGSGMGFGFMGEVAAKQALGFVCDRDRGLGVYKFYCLGL